MIDLRTFALAKTIAVGSEPTGIAANSKKNEIYVVNAGSNNVSVIDAETNAVVATIGVHGRPYFIDVAEDGRRAYVANSGSSNVSVIDLEKRTVIGNVRVGAAPGLARVSPDGATVVVSNRGDNTVSLIERSRCACARRYRYASSRRTSQSCRIRARPSWPAPVRRRLRRLSCGRAAKNSDKKEDRVLALLDVGRTPVSLALKPDGGELMVCNFDSDSISIIETGNDEVGSSLEIGQHPVARRGHARQLAALRIELRLQQRRGVRHRPGPAHCDVHRG